MKASIEIKGKFHHYTTCGTQAVLVLSVNDKDLHSIMVGIDVISSPREILQERYKHFHIKYEEDYQHDGNFLCVFKFKTFKGNDTMTSGRFAGGSGELLTAYDAEREKISSHYPPQGHLVTQI